MGIRSKTLLIVILALAAIGVLILRVDNENLFKGQIFEQPKTAVQNTENAKLPDLKADLEIINPQNKKENLKVKAAIKNIGDAKLEGEKPFKYSLLINNVEIFSNSDSFSTIEIGEEFSFEYPISKAIYSYPNKGKVKFIVDTENNIKEKDKNNNIIEKSYSY